MVNLLEALYAAVGVLFVAAIIYRVRAIRAGGNRRDHLRYRALMLFAVAIGCAGLAAVLYQILTPT